MIRITLRFRRFASTAPPLKVKWFYATDVPSSKPKWQEYTQTQSPAKFVPFSKYDNSRLEERYNKAKEDKDKEDKDKEDKDKEDEDKGKDKSLALRSVEVNEDRLFEVDLDSFELAPIYWDGPKYEVRRGTWFHTNGMPLSGKLSAIIEKGYQRAKPWQYDKEYDLLSKETVAKFNRIKLDEVLSEDIIDPTAEQDVIDLENGKLLLFYNDKDAIMFPRAMNVFQLNVIRSLGPNGSLLSVQNIQRGFSEDMTKSILDELPSNPIPDVSNIFSREVSTLFKGNTEDKKGTENKDVEGTREKEDGYSNKKTSEKSPESGTPRMGLLQNDFSDPSGPSRPIDHLVLCIHGIGQILGHKYESVNFTHSINVMRNTMREVYDSSEDYKKLNNDCSTNGVQVLPISWRHRVDFHPSRPFDLKDEKGNHRLPTLGQLTVDGIKPLRNILGDVILDVLLYYEPRYIKQIFSAVVAELNRVYRLYKERNPGFNGQVHIMGHSLGSAIAFDIMCNKEMAGVDLTLDFDVDNLFLVGSPVGVFQLLRQKNLVSRELANTSELVSAPKCTNLYNLFHPCDPIGYRMEPLVDPTFAEFKAEKVPFAVKGITQFEDLAGLGDEISRWTKGWWGDNKKKKKDAPLSIEEKAKGEDAVGDIIKTLSWGAGGDKCEEVVDSLGSGSLRKLAALNDRGRVDYQLPMGVFDVSLVSGLVAHVSYFEDKNTAGFMLKELLSKKERVKEKKVLRMQCETQSNEHE